MTEPSPAAAWQVHPTDRLASVLLLLLLPVAVEAVGSAGNCAVPGLEECLALTPDQLRFHLRGAAAQKLGLEEVAVGAVVEVQVVLLALPVFQEQWAAATVGLVLESPPSYSVVSRAVGLAVVAAPAVVLF